MAKSTIVRTKGRKDYILNIVMDQTSGRAHAASPPEGYHSLQRAAMMFLKAFPNRHFRQVPRGQSLDEIGSAGRVIARETPLYGRNASSHVFEQIRPSHSYVLSEDLTRAEHSIWPTAPGGFYTELAVKVEEFNAYLRKEIRFDVIHSRRTA